MTTQSARERLLRSYYREVPTHPDSIAGLARMSELLDLALAEEGAAAEARALARVAEAMKVVSEKHVLTVGGYGVWCGQDTGCNTYFDGFSPPTCQVNPEYGWVKETLVEHLLRALLAAQATEAGDA